jgi:mitochondrial-processing peptidase subunit beta
MPLRWRVLTWHAPVQVMQAMLGQWTKDSGAAHHPRSALATTIAQNGLAERMVAFNSPYHDTGLFGVYAQTSEPKKLDDLSWAIMTVRAAGLPHRLCSCGFCVR